MSSRKERLEAIRRIVGDQAIGNQEELQQALEAAGFVVTQATLSRDIRQLKIAKHPAGENGEYVYRLPATTNTEQTGGTEHSSQLPVEFSGNLAVIRTRPGYAQGIASDIDAHGTREILATIAGDDTILVIPREGVSRAEVLAALARFI